VISSEHASSVRCLHQEKKMSTNLNIIDTLEKDGKFSSFARMLRSSKAADLMAGAGPFTVFAPTNDAFGKIPDKQMNDWLSQTDQTDLAKVLSYHMVGSKLFSSRLTSERPAGTLSGEELKFSDNNGLKVNTSGVLGRNIEATNGIIHALDTVLTPPAKTAAASAVAATAVAAPSTIAPSPVPAAAPAAVAATGPLTQADGDSGAPPAVTPEAAPKLAPVPSTPSIL